MSQKPFTHVSKTVKDDLDWFHASLSFVLNIWGRDRITFKCEVMLAGHSSSKPQNGLEMKRRLGLARHKFQVNVGLPDAGFQSGLPNHGIGCDQLPKVQGLSVVPFTAHP